MSDVLGLGPGVAANASARAELTVQTHKAATISGLANYLRSRPTACPPFRLFQKTLPTARRRSAPPVLYGLLVAFRARAPLPHRRTHTYTETFVLSACGAGCSLIRDRLGLPHPGCGSPPTGGRYVLLILRAHQNNRAYIGQLLSGLPRQSRSAEGSWRTGLIGAQERTSTLLRAQAASLAARPRRNHYWRSSGRFPKVRGPYDGPSTPEQWRTGQHPRVARTGRPVRPVRV
jgi:hypothetical protein